MALLDCYKIRTLIDIRAYPQSKRLPHFSEESLRQSIINAGIDYHWAGRHLGGMRKPVSATSHSALPADSFRGFAEYMETPEFERAITHLQNLAAKAPTAIMCAEKQAANCHRSLISDYLVFHDIEVEHIIDEQTCVTHQLNELARIESSNLIYDRNTSGNFLFD